MRSKLSLVFMALLPAALGFVAWQMYRYGWLTDSIIYLRASLGLLLLIVGILLSALIGTVIIFYLYFDRRTRSESDYLATRSSTKHRQFLQRLDHELKNPFTTLQVELTNLDEEPPPTQPSFGSTQDGSSWTNFTRKADMEMEPPDAPRVAIYLGSFDPITFGHIDILERTVALFDRVVIALAVNLEKRPLFSLEERREMIREAIIHLPNVEVLESEGLMVDFARRQGAIALIRGLRAISDFEFEFQMALMNRTLAPRLNRVFLMPTIITPT